MARSGPAVRGFFGVYGDSRKPASRQFMVAGNWRNDANRRRRRLSGSGSLLHFRRSFGRSPGWRAGRPLRAGGEKWRLIRAAWIVCEYHQIARRVAVGFVAREFTAIAMASGSPTAERKDCHRALRTRCSRTAAAASGGNTRGLSTFNPSADTDAPVAIVADDQNPHEAPPGGKIRLQFSGIDRWKTTLPGRLLFSYRIDWRVLVSFRIRRLGLVRQTGRGTPSVRGTRHGPERNISLSAASHAFSVLFPWYEERGFLGLAVVAAAVIVLLLTLALRSYREARRFDPETEPTNKLEHDRHRFWN